MTVVGFDFSTFAIDWAWMDGTIAKHERLDLGKGPAIDRIRRVRGISLPQGTEEVCLEMPWGPNQKTTRLLMAVMGAITCRITPDARVSWIDPGDLRRAINAGNTKYDAHMRVQILCNLPHPSDDDAWSEDALDALVACIGWTRILAAQEDAA